MTAVKGICCMLECFWKKDTKHCVYMIDLLKKATKVVMMKMRLKMKITKSSPAMYEQSKQGTSKISNHDFRKW